MRFESGNHFGAETPVGHVRHAARFAAVDGDHVELVLLVLAALGDEGDPLAVGTEARLAVGRLIARQLARGAARRRDQPQVA